MASDHLRTQVVARGETGISTPRVPVKVRVGTRARQLRDHQISKAVYATACDGTVVLEASANGSFRRVSPWEVIPARL